MRIEIIEKSQKYFLEDELNKRIVGKNVKDIKFIVAPDLRNGYSVDYKYLAMIIYEE